MRVDNNLPPPLPIEELTFATDKLRAAFVARVEAEMKRQGMSKSALCQRARVGRPSLDRIMRTRKSSPTGTIELETIGRIARALGMQATITFRKLEGRPTRGQHPAGRRSVE